MTQRAGRTHSAAFKAKVALAAVARGQPCAERVIGRAESHCQSRLKVQVPLLSASSVSSPV